MNTILFSLEEIKKEYDNYKDIDKLKLIFWC